MNKYQSCWCARVKDKEQERKRMRKRVVKKERYL